MNAHALENGLLWMTVIPYILKFFVYGVRMRAHTPYTAGHSSIAQCFLRALLALPRNRMPAPAAPCTENNIWTHTWTSVDALR